MKLRASSTIRLALAPEIKYDGLDVNNPKILWEQLAKTYQSKFLASKLFLKKDLSGLTMEEDGDLRDHVNRFNRLITQLNNLDEKFKNKGKAILLLVSLPKKYNNVITCLLVEKNKANIGCDHRVSPEAERLMMQELSDTCNRALMVAKAYNNKKKGGKYNSKIKSHYCKEIDHIQYTCPKAKEDMKELKEAKEKGIIAIVQDEGDDLLLIHESVKDGWIFDSGCSNHLCGRKESFSSLKRCEDKKMTLRNGEEMEVAGVREAEIVLHNGQVVTLGQVRYVPNLEKNLISIGRMEKLGYHIHIMDGRIMITIGLLVVIVGQRNERNLYVYSMVEKFAIKGRRRGTSLSRWSF